MIRGTKRELDKQPSAVNVDFNASIHNRFDIEVVDAKTGEVKQRAQAFNVICDNLWTQLLQGNRYFQYIHYGNGTGVPSTDDNKLFGFLGYGSVSDTNKKWTVKADGAHVTGSIKLDETVAVGETLTEVGIATSTSATSLCTHAMLQDMNGNQVSILKTETDIINIYATLFLHWRNDSETVFISPSYKIDSDYGTTPTGMIGWLLGDSRADGGAAWPSRASFTDNGAHNYSDATATVYDGTKTYDLAAKTMTIKYPRLAASAANSGQILAVAIGAHGVSTTAFYMTLPAFMMLVGGEQIPAFSVENEAIGTGDGVTTDFKTAFSNLESAIIYVDGVAQGGATVDRLIPFVSGNARAGIYPGIYNDGVWALSTTNISGSSMGRGNSVPYPEGGCAYNSFYATCGIQTVNKNVLASNDLLTWTPVAAGTVPDSLQNCKYWKMEGASSSPSITVTRTRPDDNNIHFATPPAAGAVITADYVTKTIPKDSNHVYDLEVTIGFGEYTE